MFTVVVDDCGAVMAFSEAGEDENIQQALKDWAHIDPRIIELPILYQVVAENGEIIESCLFSDDALTEVAYHNGSWMKTITSN